jgi:hypothetical protein
MGLSFLVIWRPLPVVVHDLGIGRSFCRPDQAHSKLIVDPDRVLSLAIARQRFQAVAWRRPKVAQIIRSVEIAQFLARHLDQISWKPFGPSPLKTASVVWSRKFLITRYMYHLMIQASMGYVSINDTAAIAVRPVS